MHCGKQGTRKGMSMREKRVRKKNKRAKAFLCGDVSVPLYISAQTVRSDQDRRRLRVTFLFPDLSTYPIWRMKETAELGRRIQLIANSFWLNQYSKPFLVKDVRHQTPKRCDMIFTVIPVVWNVDTIRTRTDSGVTQ